MLITEVEQQNRWAESISNQSSEDPIPSQHQNLIKHETKHFDFKHNPEGALKYRIKQKEQNNHHVLIIK